MKKFRVLFLFARTSATPGPPRGFQAETWVRQTAEAFEKRGKALGFGFSIYLPLVSREWRDGVQL